MLFRSEILAAEEAAFYDFDAKYNNAESKTVVDPEMPEESKRKIKEDAEAIFRAVDGFGLSRVDFFLEESGRVVFNEINTLPGFTSISMYPPYTWVEKDPDDLTPATKENVTLDELKKTPIVPNQPIMMALRLKEAVSIPI